uniref:HDC14054 n=1 Tax=Drosophila melanogaster TaxID=7227 RepID=Q6IJW7_DROME|nr:TPA_inf: HDC14054 [Drosophila melanogaster]
MSRICKKYDVKRIEDDPLLPPTNQLWGCQQKQRPDRRDNNSSSSTRRLFSHLIVRTAAFGAPIGGNGNNSGAQWRTLGPFANQSSAYPHPLSPGPAQNCGTVCSAPRQSQSPVLLPVVVPLSPSPKKQRRATGRHNRLSKSSLWMHSEKLGSVPHALCQCGVGSGEWASHPFALGGLLPTSCRLGDRRQWLASPTQKFATIPERAAATCYALWRLRTTKCPLRTGNCRHFDA